MRSKRSDKSYAEARGRRIHSPRVHLILYSLLLVATPFILLRSYMQDAIGRLSAASIEFLGLEIPIVVLVVLHVVPLALARFRSRIRPRHVLAILVGILMIALGQRMTDYYFGHRFYELQQNWHYFAYAIFAFMVYRDLRPRAIPLARVVLITFLLAAAYSTFDEAFQLHISSRVFDMSDIAKDIWGALTGLAVLLIAIDRAGCRGSDWRKVRRKRIRDYLHHAPSTFLLLAVLGFLFMGISSLLTEYAYWSVILLLTFATYILFLLIFHFSQRRWIGYGLALLLIAAIGLQTFSFMQHRTQNINHHQYGLTIYKGIPIPYFDVMIFPDGSFRLVDKKHYFTRRDRTFFNRKCPDIILVGSGDQAAGGKGFPGTARSQFVYNPYTRQGTQVIILKTPEACQLFNRLKETGKNVLFILLNTR